MNGVRFSIAVLIATLAVSISPSWALNGTTTADPMVLPTTSAGTGVNLVVTPTTDGASRRSLSVTRTFAAGEYDEWVPTLSDELFTFTPGGVKLAVLPPASEPVNGSGITLGLCASPQVNNDPANSAPHNIEFAGVTPGLTDQARNPFAEPHDLELAVGHSNERHRDPAPLGQVQPLSKKMDSIDFEVPETGSLAVPGCAAAFLFGLGAWCRRRKAVVQSATSARV